MAPTLPKANPKWHRKTRALWQSILSEYELTCNDLSLLEAACVQHDRAQQAAEQLQKDGLFYSDRFGQTREHPAVAVERTAGNAFRLLMREVGLGFVGEVRGPRAKGYSQ